MHTRCISTTGSCSRQAISFTSISESDTIPPPQRASSNSSTRGKQPMNGLPFSTVIQRQYTRYLHAFSITLLHYCFSTLRTYIPELSFQSSLEMRPAPAFLPFFASRNTILLFLFDLFRLNSLQDGQRPPTTTNRIKSTHAARFPHGSPR